MNYKKINDPVMKYYSLDKFKYLQVDRNDSEEVQIEKKKRHNKLSYCDTCKHLRPPRAFHCAQCGVCVEVHDHHCPWVGTCIGFKNLKYFISFLFWTATVALVTVGVTAYVMFTCVDQMADDTELLFSIVAKLSFTYGCIIALCLYSFFLY